VGESASRAVMYYEKLIKYYSLHLMYTLYIGDILVGKKSWVTQLLLSQILSIFLELWSSRSKGPSPLHHFDLRIFFIKLQKWTYSWTLLHDVYWLLLCVFCI
jgi:hypothetical protein